MTGYRCVACNAEQGADFGGFRCPACGGNLDITYSYAAIEPDFGPGEGMFRYASLLPCPDPGALLPLKIGGTPLYRAPRLGATAGLDNVWLKDETGNPSASIKDRASAVALLRAKAAGADAVAVASTGNAGSSTACLAAAMGLRAVVFVPETAPAAKLTQSLVCGARVLAVRGSYDDAYDLCLQLAPVMQGDIDDLGIVYDMMIGKDETLVGIDDDTGTQACRFAFLLLGDIAVHDESEIVESAKPDDFVRIVSLVEKLQVAFTLEPAVDDIDPFLLGQG